MRIIYDLVFAVLAILYAPKLMVRMSQAENGAAFLRGRFGSLPKAVADGVRGKKIIWVHAVSVGEVIAARTWIALLLNTYGDWSVALSVTTPTGYSVASRFASERVFVFFAPLDLRYSVCRVLKHLKPKLIVLMETEIWPNLILEADRFAIPIGIVNGRISPRSFRRYRLIRPWLSPVLSKLSFCSVQTERDRAHFLALGVPGLKLAVTGNIKFDGIRVNNLSKGTLKNVRSEAAVLMAGSTSGSEETMLLRLFSKLLSTVDSNLKLILAPRHPERVRRIIRTIKRHQFKYQLYSTVSDDTWQVLMLDQMGVLASLYTHSDVVFVGGSFSRRGGQNPIEAAFCRKPILHGPDVMNFEEVYRALDSSGGAVKVSTEDELFEQCRSLLKTSSLRHDMGARAYAIVCSMQGASVRNLEYVSRWINTGAESVPTRVKHQVAGTSV